MTARYIHWKKLCKAAGVMLCLILLFTTLAPPAVFAVEHDTVRFGYFRSEKYGYLGPDGKLRGYDVHLTKAIGIYGGFYADMVGYDTVTEMEEALRSGEVDVLIDFIRTEKREQEFIFTNNPIMEEKVSLYTRSGPEAPMIDSFTQIGDLRIGCVPNSGFMEAFLTYCEKNDITPHLVEFYNENEMCTAMDRGETDCSLTGSVVPAGYRTLVSMISLNSYFMLRPDETELRDRIDLATIQLNTDYPRYISDLYRQYVVSRIQEMPPLTLREREYLARHPVLTVAVVRSTEPFVVEKDGELHGIIPDYYRNLGEKLGITFDFAVYDNTQDAIDAVTSGEAEILGKYFGDIIVAESDGLYDTVQYGVLDCVRMTRSDFNGTIKTVAVTERSDYLLLDQFAGELALRTYPNVEACYQAVMDGKADATIISSSGISWLINQHTQRRINVTILPEITLAVRGAVSRNNPELLFLLNKVIDVSHADLDQSVIENTSGGSIRLITALENVPLAFSIGVVAFLVALIVLLIAALVRVLNLRKNLHRENEKLHYVSITDGLTGIRNRMALRQDYESYQGHEVAVMILDLNNFKIINDTRGHEQGDRILRETGRLLSDTFGEAHCYRYGGDEFLVIVPDITEEVFKEKLDSLLTADIAIDEGGRSRFSIGYILGMLENSDKLRNLIAIADERMYEEKRDNSVRMRDSLSNTESVKTAAEYTVDEMKAFLKEMSEKYALARVVDPIECRILDLKADGAVSMNESCYGIWNAEQRCLNCSSALACKTGCHQEKAEHFKDQIYFIQSNPVSLRLQDGSKMEAVVELVNVEDDAKKTANNREAENIGNRAAHYLAHHDSLTNVLNSDAFYELSREIIKNNPETSWVMVTSNIMNFRLVNTLFGVLKGNEVLVRTASLLREISEAAKGLCGRLGSDQFAILIPKEAYREEALMNVSTQLSDAFSSGVYTFCIHFGVYEIDDPSIPVSVMCGRANSALRTIREDLTTTVTYFNDTIMKTIRLEQMVTGSFEEALRNNEFRMYLQPLVEKDGTIFGAEALVRWCRSDGTVMMPCDFIETLEHSGLIQRLDMHMWELAVKQLHAWKNTAKGQLVISVNLSAKDFYNINVEKVLTELVERYDVDSSLLRLEITETALMVEPDKVNAVIKKLRSRGFLVEIDDFGKGNSSLSMLNLIHADVLKIDRDFLRELNRSERNSVILQTVINLARSLGMDVITEGVETEEQLQTLSAMGCSNFQGYYFSRPIPVEEFEAKFDALRR